MEPFAASIGDIIYTLFADSQRVGIRRYEDGGSAEVYQRLFPEVLGLLERGCAVLTSILQRNELPDDPEPQAELDELAVLEEDQVDVPARVPSSPGAVIGDIAFMARSELRQHQQVLRGHRIDDDMQEMISSCGGALRAIQKSLFAIEPPLCELERIPRFLPSHLETSLQVRRHYRKLWHFALLVGDVTTVTVRGALRGAGTRVAILAGSEVYSLLREDDRFYLRDLQDRILAWLRIGENPLDAIRIWQDFSLFVEILRQVNLREELVRHDREVLLRAVGALLARGDAAVPEVDKDLRRILGISDALDEVILSNPSADGLLRELRRTAAQLGVAVANDGAIAMAL